MRKICVFTGSRAKYGLLRSVMQDIQAAETLKYLDNGNNIRFESPQRLIKQIAWPDPGLECLTPIKLLNIFQFCDIFLLMVI